MRKILKKHGNEIEITLSAQAYLPSRSEDSGSPEGQLRLLIEDRRYTLSTTINKLPLFTVPNLLESELLRWIQAVEIVALEYLDRSGNLNEGLTIERKLSENHFA